MENSSLREKIRDKSVAVSVRCIPDFVDATEEEMLQYPDAEHAIEHFHPETRRKSIYMGNVCCTVLGMDGNESKKLLNEIVDVVVQPHNVYIHEWKKGDLVIWDNISVMHRGMGGYGDYRRVLFRTQAIAQPL